MQQYLLPVGLPLGLFIVLLIGVKVELAKRPTWTEAREELKEAKVCDVIHERVDEKIGCLPEMKERQIRMEEKQKGIDRKLDRLLTNNGK